MEPYAYRWSTMGAEATQSILSTNLQRKIFLISFLIIKLFMVSLLLLLAYSEILQSAEVLCRERQRQEQDFERKHASYSAS